MPRQHGWKRAESGEWAGRYVNETSEDTAWRKRTCEELLTEGKLNDWERKFITSIRDLPRLTPKQYRAFIGTAMQPR